MNVWFSYPSQLGIFLVLLSVLTTPVLRSQDDPTRVQVVSGFFNPNTPEQFRSLVNLMREDPSLRIEMWSGLALPGGSSRTPIIMSIAGETSPDLMDSWFHTIRSDIAQGFLYPLNEWIGDDLDGDGRISDSEAKWPGWKNVPELWKRVATVDGKVYGLPQPGENMMGVLYRIDLVRAAGLDPNRPPKTWDEFYEWCLRLTNPGKPVPGRIYNNGQRAIALLPYGFTWLPWLESAGGTPLKQIVTDPETRTVYEFAMNETRLVTKDGRDLSREKISYRADFDSPAGLAAAGFLHRLRWAPWVIDPVTGDPIFLTDEQVRAGTVSVGDRPVNFTPDSVLQGVGRSEGGARELSPLQLLGRGEVAMLTWFVSGIQSGAEAGVNPELIGWFPFPSMDAETPRIVQVQRHFATMVTNVRLRPKADRDKVWRVLETVTDGAARDQEIERLVISGLARFVNPRDLERLGFQDYVREIPPAILENFREIDSGAIRTDTEPYQGFWLTMDGALNREALSLIIAQSGKDFDYVKALHEITLKANSGVMFARSEADLAQHRGTAFAIFLFIVAVVLVLTVLIVRQMMTRGGDASRSGMVSRPWLPWLLLLPALLLIGLWGYYPLLRGMVMAFQDYRIAGESLFVGLDNFIALALDRSFWASMVTTLYFVFLTMLLSFTAPIILAVMVSEVPRGKVFFRTLFFLPQVTSALVIALIWKMMYDPTPNGLFNQLIQWLNYLPGVQIDLQSWLLDPKLAMFCVVLPTAWATAGIQSLIYLAALKGVPDDLYEACEIDSGGIWAKLRHITLPVLMPLIIINFVGAFIGTFQNMGKIFLLTFGGPGEATMVVGMRIWIEAYNNLRFSMATSMAWVLGACLIGFTYLQIQFLKKIEFRKAKD